MLGSIRFALLVLAALTVAVYCEEEMNLNVAIVDPKNDLSDEDSSELVDESKQAAEGMNF